jgi:hypothetical protein
MAKKKHKKNAVLPKRIAGVKVPKSVRKGPFGQLLASRTGQALLAEAIMAAGAVGVARKSDDKDGAHAESAPPLLAGLAADALRRWQGAGRGHDNETGPMGATIAYALGEAARVFVRALGEHQEAASPAETPAAAEWRRRADNDATQADLERSKKNPGARLHAST